MALHGHVSSEHLKAGFQFEGARVPLVNPQRGIFKPRIMSHLLSIRTVYPRSGAKVWYDDQRQVHDEIFAGQETVGYAFMGTDPNAADNRWLRGAYEAQTPIIYFLGIAPGQYQAVLPAFICGWDASQLSAKLTFGNSADRTLSPPVGTAERRYALTEVKRRLHQAQFRAAVISAYGGRCALSRLPEARLLDAAHIVSDADETLGQPVVPNGLPLSKIHHAAFDTHLIGIDPDFRLHVSSQLLDQDDGPVLESIKALNGETLHLPQRQNDWPDRDRLAKRFEAFRAVA